MPEPGRRGRPPDDRSELPELVVPVTTEEFQKVFLAHQGGQPGGPYFVRGPKGVLEPLPGFAVRERRALLMRLAWSIVQTQERAEEFGLDAESRARLSAAKDAFTATAYAFYRYWSKGFRSENAVMLSDEAAERLPMPPYLVCETAALFVVLRGGGDEGNERLDVSMARWFELGDPEESPTSNRRLWSGLIRRAAALLEIASRHDPETEQDDEEFAWTMDVLSELRQESDGVSRAIARIARSMEGTMQPGYRPSGRRRRANLSESSPNVEAYLWRRCGVGTEEIKGLLRKDEDERVTDARVASVVEAAKVALTRPGERFARRGRETA